jgi:hypothetical protein
MIQKEKLIYGKSMMNYTNQTTTIMMIHTQLSHIIVYDDDANLEFLNSSVGLLRR